MANILLVEDDDMNRDMLSRRLARRGHVISVAINGQEAIDKASAERPDIVLMDMSLPLIDGWEATRRIKSDDGTRQIPIIALTAHAMKADEQKALDAGCNDYDTKPVNLKRLLAKIDALVS